MRAPRHLSDPQKWKKETEEEWGDVIRPQPFGGGGRGTKGCRGLWLLLRAEIGCPLGPPRDTAPPTPTQDFRKMTVLYC